MTADASIKALAKGIGLVSEDEFADLEAALAATFARAPIPPSEAVMDELRAVLAWGHSCLWQCPADCLDDASDELLAWLATIPGSAHARSLGTQRAIAWERFALANVYDRDDEERERVIRETAPVLADVPVKHRASSIASLSSERPALAEKYIPPLVRRAGAGAAPEPRPGGRPSPRGGQAGPGAHPRGRLSSTASPRSSHLGAQ